MPLWQEQLLDTSLFNKIGVVYQKQSDTTRLATDRLRAFLSRQPVTVTESVISAHPQQNDLHLTDPEALHGSDLVIVVGGDGTMLCAARALAAADIPLLCINLGRLGFLADIPLEQMEPVLAGIFAGELFEEQRQLLDMEILRDDQVSTAHTAFNDVVLHKWDSLRMIEFETFIDGRSVNRQRADGLVISTPTGSTAYALSSGGPIAYPSMDAVLLVPVSPHAMGVRPMVVPGNSAIEVRLIPGSNEQTRISYDGQGNLQMLDGDLLRVTASNHRIKLIHPADYDYFEILRTKLHWGK